MITTANRHTLTTPTDRRSGRLENGVPPLAGGRLGPSRPRRPYLVGGGTFAHGVAVLLHEQGFDGARS